MLRVRTHLGLVAVVLLLGGCDTGNDSDLDAYIAEVKQRPAGSIEALPGFRPYESFVYSAARLRSPFELPVDVERRIYSQSSSDVKPDFNREKEYLEGFDLSSLRMVGTLEKGGTLWALVRDDAGMINWVTDGNYIGKNHGKIIETTESKIEILEIVSDGLDGWVERPSVLALSEKE
ncbi:pilus assembly protein PilP [Teredinibacter turnerae]|uniref:Type 4 fimbrial biogenesis protein PilP n=1 Tax=Teredinibacter turnerae (strain ATCC 39867 / T7901) TaxID=377629 RepID=C5BRK0_TERTT|nr:pilus assembly protein PilP [Teredinibacter turnerae]ACR13468.1 type 4 fimbrial biogenesis protein PilP [Teredinibacter turnerae T7901]